MINKYNTSPAFQENYFYKNAFEKYTKSIQEFMFWRRGSFLPPHKKQSYLKQFMEEEQVKYYQDGVFSLPSVQFVITTRCTLRCRDCSVMIPRFGHGNHKHIETTFEQFKQDFDCLVNAVDAIGTVLLLGGEPLLHKELPKMLAYVAENSKVGLVDIVTNCTILPSPELLNIAHEYRHKVFFGLSNYSSNQDLSPVLKRAEIIDLLKKNDIKHTLDTGEGQWFQFSLKKCEYTLEEIKTLFANCHWHHCLYVLDGLLAVCPRSLIGNMLGAFHLNEDEVLLLRESSTEAIRKKLIQFYEMDHLDACRYCHRHEGLVAPAIQLL